MSDLGAIKNRLVPGLIETTGGQAAAGGKSVGTDAAKFTDLFKDLLQSVNDVGLDATQAQEAFLAGDPVELHQVMIKAEEAGISLDLLLEVRNKLMDAYNTVMRMPM
jgi:flagellar hook-basal body complex protein FliE